ncbi:hypothetical protein Nepgr_017555 [Nepenthes gracilis]|uniref:RNase H type-1 domain-containing protein n=1 Tax=Nepenthes gracilis TaxID=150966 RepID=A0AAD3SRU5_NEPGR|nr:hypothetical protein Nepgr_017555 [Nepenthes gracilis]
MTPNLDVPDIAANIDRSRDLICTLHVDGSSTEAGNVAGVVLQTSYGLEIKYSITLEFPTTNNVAKYEALLAELLLAKECSAKALVIYSDSKLVVN